MTKKIKKLKACPFCGGEPRYMTVEIGDSLNSEYSGSEYIECSKCGASTNLTYPAMDDVKKIVIEKWNRRTTGTEPLSGPVSSGTPCTFKENPDRVEPL